MVPEVMSLAARGGAKSGWRHFGHGADIGVCGVGASPAEAFEQAAVALTAVITDPALVEQRSMIAIRCSAPFLDVLFVDWLNAIVFEMSTRSMLFGRFAVDIEEGRLLGRAWGEPVDIDRHRPAVEIKGATFTELSVEQADGGIWTARCVVDV